MVTMLVASGHDCYISYSWHLVILEDCFLSWDYRIQPGPAAAWSWDYIFCCLHCLIVFYWVLCHPNFFFLHLYHWTPMLFIFFLLCFSSPGKFLWLRVKEGNMFCFLFICLFYSLEFVVCMWVYVFKHKFFCLGFCVMWNTRLPISRWCLCSTGQRLSQLTWSTGHVLHGFFPGRSETILQVCQGRKLLYCSFFSIPVQKLTYVHMCRHNTQTCVHV